MLEAVDQTSAHDEVHTAVTTNFLGELTKLGKDWVFVLLFEGSFFSFWHKAV